MIFEIIVAGVFATFISAVAFALLGNPWATRRLYPFVVGTICMISIGKMLAVADMSMVWLGLLALALMAVFRVLDKAIYRAGEKRDSHG